MITIDLIDEHFDQPEKPVRVQAPNARNGRARQQAHHEEIFSAQEAYDAEHSRLGLFAGIWFGIQKLFNR